MNPKDAIILSDVGLPNVFLFILLSFHSHIMSPLYCKRIELIISLFNFTLAIALLAV